MSIEASVGEFSLEQRTLSAPEEHVIELAVHKVLNAARDRQYRRRIFVDCGFNTGKVLSGFISKLPPDFRFFGFDVMDELAERARGLERAYPDRISSLEIAAVSGQDGVVNFRRARGSGTNYRGGTSIMDGYLPGQLVTEEVSVRAIDFSSWLRRKFDAEDFVTVKMDIEGAEYDVLEKLINDKTISLIGFLIVEFHKDNFSTDERNAYNERHRKIVENLDAVGLPFLEWH